MGMSQLLTKMTIFIVLMVIGYVGARSKFLNAEFTKAASQLTLNVFMSASIINSVIANPPAITGRELAVAFLAGCGLIVLVYLVAAVSVRLLRIEKERAPLVELLIAVLNTMFIGLPVVNALFGSVAVFYVALSCIPYNILLYTYGVWRLKSGGGNEGLRLKDMISIPFIATVVALAIFLLRLPMPGVVKELTSTMAAATMPLSMIVIGSSLGKVSLLDAFREKSLYIMVVIKLLICPLVVYAVLGIFIKDPVLLATMVINAACPSGAIVTVLAIQYGADAEYTSKGILLGTILSMATIPALAYILF